MVLTLSRDISDVSSDPGGKSGSEWTRDIAASVEAIWSINGGLLSSVAETNSLTANIFVGAGFTSYGNGLRVAFVPVNSNSGSMTLNISGVGAKALVDPDGDALTSGAVVAGRITEAIFYEDDDHFRLVTSGGTVNVTVTGGIIVQRSSTVRLVVDTTQSIELTPVGSINFQCLYEDSIVVVEGNNSRVTAAGSSVIAGTVIALYVDGVEKKTFTDYCQSGAHSNTGVSFEYTPGDTNPHTYEIRVSSVVPAVYPAGGNWLKCFEFSSNS